MRRVRFVAMLSALALGTVCHGQIKVALRDVTQAPTATPVVLSGVVTTGNVVTVSTADMVAAIPWTTSFFNDYVMWVYDEASLTGAPTQDIGAINIVWDADFQVNHIRLLVAPPPLTRERDGGNIHADVTATAADSSITAFPAVAFVTAYRSIQGAINADAGTGAFASIDNIRVTNATESDPGITGDILAENGRINSVITTGKIGTSASVRSNIRAGFGIVEVRALDLSNQLLDRDFSADTQANAALPPSAGGSNPTPSADDAPHSRSRAGCSARRALLPATERTPTVRLVHTAPRAGR